MLTQRNLEGQLGRWHPRCARQSSRQWVLGRISITMMWDLSCFLQSTTISVADLMPLGLRMYQIRLGKQHAPV